MEYVVLFNKEYLEFFNKISLGTLITVILALLFLGGLIMKGLDRYHRFKKTIEEKDNLMDGHTKEIRELNKDVNEIKGKIDDVLDVLDSIKENADQREARRLRREILKFGDNIRNGKTFSKDAFQDIIESNEEYENIIKRRNLKNGFTEQEMVFIVKKYHELYGG